MKIRLILFFLTAFALLFLASPSNKNSRNSQSAAAFTCLFDITGNSPSGPLEIEGVAATTMESINIKIEGASAGDHEIEIRKAGATDVVSTCHVSNGSNTCGIPANEHGVFEVSYDQYSFFGTNCINYVTKEKSFFVFNDDVGSGTSNSGLNWLILPHDPPWKTDRSISIYIYGANALTYEDEDGTTGGSLKAFMVKSYGSDERGGDDPGFTGSFASQANDPQTHYTIKDGGGDICDKNPHRPYHGDEDKNGTPDIEDDENGNCVDDGHWGLNDFIKPVDSVPGKGDKAVLAIKGICENMAGVRSDCSAKFDSDTPYTFAIYGVDIPPEKDVEKEPEMIPGNPGNSDSEDYCDTEDKNDPPDVDTCDVHGPLKYISSGLTTGKAVLSFTSVDSEDTKGSFNSEDSVETPFGTITLTPAKVAQAVLNLGLGAAGGIAFLLIAFGSYKLIFAGGDPEAVQSGKQIISAAIAGLLVIIFSVFILNLIGVGVLGLPIGP